MINLSMMPIFSNFFHFVNFTDDVEMDQEKTQQNNNTSNKKVDRKQLLKRLGKKRHFKKANKKIKW